MEGVSKTQNTNIKKTNTYKKVFLASLPIIMLIISQVGITIPEGGENYKKVGAFTIKSYDYGVFLEQANSSIYYNISPFDFYFSKDGESPISNVMPFSGEKNADKTTNNNLFTIKSVFKTIKSYFGLGNPKAEFSNINVTSNVDGNRIIFYSKINSYASEQDKKLVYKTSLSYNEEDIILDQNGVLYTNVDQDIIRDFEAITGIKTKKLETLKKYEPIYIRQDKERIQHLLIINIKTPGIIKIPAENQVIDILDRENRIIGISSNPQTLDNSELEESNIDLSESKMVIEVYDSIKEGLNSVK